MVTGKGSTDVNIELDGENMEQLYRFKYFGVNATNKELYDIEIPKRLTDEINRN